jgi:hypothetical protein
VSGERRLTTIKAHHDMAPSTSSTRVIRRPLQRRSIQDEVDTTQSATLRTQTESGWFQTGIRSVGMPAGS